MAKTETIYKVIRYIHGERLARSDRFGSHESAQRHANMFLATGFSSEQRRVEIVPEQVTEQHQSS